MSNCKHKSSFCVHKLASCAHKLVIRIKKQAKILIVAPSRGHKTHLCVQNTKLCAKMLNINPKLQIFEHNLLIHGYKLLIYIYD